MNVAHSAEQFIGHYLFKRGHSGWKMTEGDISRRIILDRVMWNFGEKSLGYKYPLE